ncbi:MAG: insulinase family protein [Gemmatimonadetes bacterium]|nr:insulinase family protein [Gemmatimonadota bacterium]
MNRPFPLPIRHFGFCLFLTFATFFSMSIAQAPEAAAQEAVAEPAVLTEGATVEGVTEYTLSNGLRVLLVPDASKQTATVNITYFVGSRHEAYGETGMPHLLEHLVFKGTPDHPDIPQELTERGARPNGTTWFDRTNYFETFTATEENLEWALDLESDRMVNSFISGTDLDSEMTVVRNEWESGENSPFGVLMKRTMSTAFQWHNYGNSTIGARADLENVPIERLQAFYRKYYQPDNAMLVIAGRFEPDRAKELVIEKFGAIPRPVREGGNILWPTYTAEPTQDGERTVTLRRVGDTQLVMAVYHIPPGSHDDFAAVDVLSDVLGDEPSGRLYEGLVETGLAARSGAFTYQLREPGALMLYAEVREDGSLANARTALAEVTGDVVTTPPTDEEVERAKASLLTQFDQIVKNSERLALNLTEWGSMGDWRLFFLHRDRIKEVLPERVRVVAASYLKPSNRTVGVFIPVDEEPARAEIPEAPDVMALVAGYTGSEEVIEGEEFDPSPANIESRTTRLELDNGFEVALLPKRTRGATVAVSLTLRHGTESALMGRATDATMAGGMLMRGTSTRTREEISDEIDRLKARVSVMGGANSAFARIETTRDNLISVLRLVGDVLTDPVFDAAEWGLLKEERLASIERQMSEPTARASEAFSRHMSPWPEDHPFYSATFEEEVERMNAADLEAARAFHAQFYGAQAGTMAIVGDFDPDEVRVAVEEMFGLWTADSEYVRIPRPFQDIEAADLSIETPDKANAFFLAGQTIEMGDEHPDYPALVLGTYMVGGGFLNSRLAVRIRQEEGLSYGVAAFFSASPLDESGSFAAYAIYAPENAEALEAAFREEVGKVLADGFEAEEVQAAKDGWLDSRNVSRAQDRELASALAGGLFLDRTLEHDAELEARIAALSVEQINAAMRQHIDLSRVTVVKAGDFAGAGEDPELVP